MEDWHMLRISAAKSDPTQMIHETFPVVWTASGTPDDMAVFSRNEGGGLLHPLLFSEDSGDGDKSRRGAVRKTVVKPGPRAFRRQH